jgi:amino acid adenylation domain-containing protein
VVLAQHRFAPLVPAGTTVVWLDGVADGAEDAGTADPDADSDAITASGGDAAYVMYTSGSTGRPKGVVISHAAICNRLAWMQEAFRLAAGERVLQKTPVGFDVSVWEFFWPLMAGAVVVLARPGGHQDARYLVRSMREQQVSVAHFVPSMLKLFLEEPGAGELPALKRVVCSGEALSASLAARCKAALPGAGLFNLYGPTEAAVDVTWWDCRQQAPQGVVPIGRPVANTRVLVLDRWLAAVPDGVPGELYLGGVQLARGYAGRPGLTAERFVASPFGPAGQRLLRTGDRARVLPGGVVEFLGRADGQVKLRGYRIELGEVEQVLAAHDWVREAAAVVRDGPAGPQLAAYLTGRAGCRLDLDEVRGHLKARLPSYMIPAHLIILDALPLTPNGKTNRNALPPPPETTSAATRIRPRTPREEAVTRVFCDVLGLAEVSVTTSFFDLGGDSFSAVRAIRRIEGASVAALAANPTARGLAEALDAEDSQRVLVRLNAADPRPRRTLVCVPFGGGNALNYVPLARVIPSQIALLAVSLPGHDVGSDEPLRPLDEVADTCVEQILREAQGAVSVYGHCIGVALATEIVRRLEAAGMGVDRLFLAGSYPFYAGSLAARITGLLGNRGADADQRKIRYLQSLGGFRDVADPREVEFVMRNFNHDDLCARQYFSRQWSGKRLVRLQAPITFIAGAEDPETRNYKRRFRTWCKFSGSVDLAVVPGGGHYFLGERAEIVSRIIQRALAINDEQRTHTASRLGAERA